MSSFRRVRSHEELNKLIDSFEKNRKILKDQVDEESLSAQAAQHDYAKQQAPTLKGLEAISQKIDERLAPAVLDAQGKPVLDDKKQPVRIDLMSEIYKGLLGQSNESILRLLKEIKPITEKIAKATNDSDGRLVGTLRAISELKTFTGQKQDDIIKELKGMNVQEIKALLQQLVTLRASAGPASLPGGPQQPPAPGAAPKTTGDPQPSITTSSNSQIEKDLESAMLQTDIFANDLASIAPAQVTAYADQRSRDQDARARDEGWDENFSVSSVFSYLSPSKAYNAVSNYFTPPSSTPSGSLVNNASSTSSTSKGVSTNTQPDQSVFTSTDNKATQPMPLSTPVNPLQIAQDAQQQQRSADQLAAASSAVSINKANVHGSTSTEVHGIFDRPENEKEKPEPFQGPGNKAGDAGVTFDEIEELHRKKGDEAFGYSNFIPDGYGTNIFKIVQKINKEGGRSIRVKFEGQDIKDISDPNNEKKIARIVSNVGLVKAMLAFPISKFAGLDFTGKRLDEKLDEGFTPQQYINAENEWKQIVGQTIFKTNPGEEINRTTLKTKYDIYQGKRHFWKGNPKLKRLSGSYETSPEGAPQTPKRQKSTSDRNQPTPVPSPYKKITTHTGEKPPSSGKSYKPPYKVQQEHENKIKQQYTLLQQLKKPGTKTPLSTLSTSREQLENIYNEFPDQWEEMYPGLSVDDGYLLAQHGLGAKLNGIQNKHKRREYRMEPDGTFGSIKINPKNLQKLILTAHKQSGKGMKRICHQKCDYDTLELLTKRYNPKKNYSEDSKDIFNKLISHAEIPIDSVQAGKFKHIISKSNKIPKEDSITEEKKAGCLECKDENIKVFDSPDDMATRLHILIGEIQAHNDNPALKNEASQIADLLLKNGHIKQEDHRNLMHMIKMI